MKKVLLKIIALMLASMILVLGISRLTIVFMSINNEVSTKATYIVSLISGFIGLGCFLLLLQIFVFRRITRISKAVDKIKDGSFDINLKDDGKDEISDLSNNINIMVGELKSNEYLSKEFINNVSHEFKTPVSSIIGFSDLLLEDNDLTVTEKNEYIGIINDESKRLYNMSMSMLKISALDSHEIIQASDLFSPDKQIKKILLALQKKWLDKSITINLDLDDAQITSNEELFGIIFQNLITNAVNFCYPNGVINISLKIHEQKLLFEISNTGAKIIEKEKVFDYFYTVKNESNKEGSGLGLPLVKKIVTKLNGNISFDSNDERTIFSIHIPV